MFIVKIKLDDTERGREENNHHNLAAKNILSYICKYKMYKITHVMQFCILPF